MNSTINKFVTPYDIRQLPLAALWVAKTGILAWLAPYFVASVLVAVFITVGASLEDVRRIITMFASLETNSWSRFNVIWDGYAIICYSIVILYRALGSRLFRNGLDHLDQWAVKKLNQKYVAISFGVMGSLLLLGMFAFPTTNTQPKNVNGLPLSQLLKTDKQMAPSAMAAITLQDGSIQSGDAVVVQATKVQYMVTFTEKGMHGATDAQYK